MRINKFLDPKSKKRKLKLKYDSFIKEEVLNGYKFIIIIKMILKIIFLFYFNFIPILFQFYFNS